MTNKQKIDEAAILNVATNSNGMTGETTFVADDVVALAALLKRAGLQSANYNGPAMLSVETQEDGASVTSRITAPDLRSIMTLLEPEFQQAGDAEAARASMNPGMSTDAQYDAEVELEPNDLDTNLDGVDDASPVDIEVVDEPELADESTEMQSYPGVTDLKPLQADTRSVPARSADNPMKGFRDYFKETSEKNYVAPRPEATLETLMNEFEKRRMPPQPRDFNTVALAAREASKGGFVQHVDRHEDGTHSISDWMSDNTVGSFSNGQWTGGRDVEEGLDEAGRTDWQSKVRQYGEPYYLNTDCGYASLESIMQGEGFFDDMEMGLANHSTKVGFTVLEIDRNGRKGFNYVNSPDTRLTPGASVTCITQTPSGQKMRPGKFIGSFTAKDLSTNYEQVVAKLAQIGISPSKKLPVKTFD